nr:MgtC/SapB family protein [Pectinatus sottacetonis]
MPPEWEACMRLVLSAVLGGLIGYERQYKHKSAGLRTNILVCVGSCLIMLLSQLLYSNVEGRTNADPARLAAQVVSGIGFLGAGAIIKEGVNIIGLTTAACIWVVSGVGLAVGAGYYSGAGITSVIVFIVLVTLSRMDRWMDHDKLSIVITMQDIPGQVMKVYTYLHDNHIVIKSIQIIALPNNLLRLELIIHTQKNITMDKLDCELAELENVINVEVS